MCAAKALAPSLASTCSRQTPNPPNSQNLLLVPSTPQVNAASATFWVYIPFRNCRVACFGQPRKQRRSGQFLGLYTVSKLPVALFGQASNPPHAPNDLLVPSTPQANTVPASVWVYIIPFRNCHVALFGQASNPPNAPSDLLVPSTPQAKTASATFCVYIPFRNCHVALFGQASNLPKAPNDLLVPSTPNDLLVPSTPPGKHRFGHFLGLYTVSKLPCGTFWPGVKTSKRSQRPFGTVNPAGKRCWHFLARRQTLQTLQASFGTVNPAGKHRSGHLLGLYTVFETAMWHFLTRRSNPPNAPNDLLVPSTPLTRGGVGGTRALAHLFYNYI